MLKEALEYLIDLRRPTTVDVDGRAYSTQKLEPMPFPQPAPLEGECLGVITQYVRASADEFEPGDLLIHIVSPTRVELVTRLYGEYEQRDVLARAEFHGKPFEFGKAYTPEAMIAALQTQFAQVEPEYGFDGGDIAKVLALCGCVTESATKEYADDGVTQVVTARSGVASNKGVVVPNPVMLYALNRTFAETRKYGNSADLSPFILRAGPGGQNAKPTFTLHECDGGVWRINAIDSIRRYLRAELPDKCPPIIG